MECRAFSARLGKHEPFKELITAAEAALDLRAHRVGALPRHASYLHQRTAGRIGSLPRLLRQAAITAILDSPRKHAWLKPLLTEYADQLASTIDQRQP